VKHIATPTPAGVQPVSSVMPGNCQYPWCENPVFTTDGSEMVVRARVASMSVTGNMHVSHTTLYMRYGDKQLKAYDDGVDEYVGVQLDAPREPSLVGRAGQRLLNEILGTVPTDTIYRSNVEDLVERLDVHEVLIIKKAGGSMYRTRVHSWRRMP
jgi:hypothetical protein